MRDADDALEKWEQAQEIAAALQSCAGWSLDQDVRSVKDSVRVFRGNHRELDLAMRIVDDPGRWLPLASVDNREGHAAYIDELDRLLHNYLASAYSLSSCMFKITERRKWDSLPVRGEYRSRNPFVRAGPSAFMFGLRHVAQHQRIPLTTSGSRGWRDEASGQLVSEDYFLVILDVVRTLDWSRDPRGNAYLETLIEDPRLDDLVPAFTSALLQFADWFTDRFRYLPSGVRGARELARSALGAHAAFHFSTGSRSQMLSPMTWRRSFTLSQLCWRPSGTRTTRRRAGQVRGVAPYAALLASPSIRPRSRGDQAPRSRQPCRR